MPSNNRTYSGLNSGRGKKQQYLPAEILPFLEFGRVFGKSEQGTTIPQRLVITAWCKAAWHSVFSCGSTL